MKYGEQVVYKDPATGTTHTCDVLHVSDLLCVVDGHSKFWTGVLLKHSHDNVYYVLLRWGRIGTKGNSPDHKKFLHGYHAKKYLSSREQDKLSKGYVVSTPELLAAAEAENGPKVRSKPLVVDSTEFEWDL